MGVGSGPVSGLAHALGLNNQVIRMVKEGHTLGAYSHARREGIPKILMVIHGVLFRTILTQPLPAGIGA